MSQKISDSANENAQPLTARQQLVDDLAAGCKPRSAWRIGTEHEKFVFHWDDLRPVAYDGEHGIGSLLRRLSKGDWQPIQEGDNIIGLRSGGASITLEPGGQLELSGAPLSSIHETCAEVHEHLAAVKTAAEPLRLGFLGMGFHPSAQRDDIPWMPKDRYRIMRAYMPKVGDLGLDMMTRTCTVQVNLDFASESDMVRKFRVALALQPLATALFANSPFTEGQPNGFLSYRAHIWTRTDPDRTGLLDFVFEPGMGFERYVEYMLDVPMYFVYRNGRYIDAAGQSFRDFMNGRLPALPGVYPTMSDWSDHLTTAFPEVRLKQFLEMRGADGGAWERLCALPALWVGLLYDDTALDAAEQLIRDWSVEDIRQLQWDVSRHALQAQVHGRPMRDVAMDALEIARDGLAARGFLNPKGNDESHFLNQLFEIADSGVTPAEVKLQRFANDWDQSVQPLFTEFAY
ncbi:MAG: glutamate--cysteine ligase [Wenzhouxiangellaceae bacterium]